MKDIKDLSSNIRPRIGGMIVHKAASTLFAVHNSRRLVDVKWKLLQSGSSPLGVHLLCTYLMSSHMTSLTPPYFHSASDQRLEVGTAWEQCYAHTCPSRTHCEDFSFYLCWGLDDVNYCRQRVQMKDLR